MANNSSHSDDFAGNLYLENKAPDNKSSFYSQPSKIAESHWNQYFPYQLVILQAIESGGTVVYKKTPWVFTLPIPPQELSVNMPFASTVEATLGGIVEKHNGAPFRDIVLSGTTGVTPIKNSAETGEDPSGLSLSKAIFAGTSSAALAAAKAAPVVTSGQSLNKSNVNNGVGQRSDQIPEHSTGYYQFRLLQKFLEGYAEYKKKNLSVDELGCNSRDLRLALCIWKDESIYLVTGVNFMFKRSASSTMEYLYSLNMKAWKRISTIANSKAIVASEFNPVARDPNAYSDILTRMIGLNDVLQNSISALSAVSTDVASKVLEVGRQVTTFVKLTSGAGLAISDLPNTIQKDVIEVLVNNWSRVAAQFPVMDKAPPGALTEGINKRTPHLGTKRQGADSQSIHDILGKIKPDMLPLPLAVSKQIAKEKASISGLTRLDFERFRDDIINAAADFADAVGANDVIYNATYNRQSSIKAKTPTDEDYKILWAMNEMALVFSYLAASRTVNPPTLTSLEYVAGLAEQSGIAFKVPTSKYAVPFPYGFTLERLAAQYLGNANRWHEIATLNGLREPYVDEVGFSLDFLVNGDGNKLYVASKDNLYINQTVWISSSVKPLSKRRITNVKEIYSGFVEITVDGDADLADYKSAAKASMQAFLPGTVNSQQLIYLPSDKSVNQDFESQSIPGVDQFDPLLQISGVDLLLTPDGDLAVTPDGDCRLAYGLQNIIQTIKLALTTPRGTLLQHPQYGIGLKPGMSTADIDAQEIVNTAVAMFEGDPAFTGIKSAQVVKNGPIVQITIVVGITGLSQNVPITFNIG